MPENRLEMQQTQRLSQLLQTSIRLLAGDRDELTEEIRKAAQENPALEIVPPKKSPQEVSLLMKTRYRSRGANGADGYEPAAAQTQLENLEQQLRLCSLDEQTMRSAMRMLHMLTPRGYFPQETEAFAAETGVTPEIAQRALEAVQSLEPAGVGARTVEECLELQLRARAETDALCYELVRHHLQDIGKGSFRRIAQKTGAGLAHVQACVETIRRLTPFPCSLDHETTCYIVPEFSVDTDEAGQLTVQFYQDYYPSLRMDEHFARLSQALEGEELAFAQRMRAAASRIVQAVELRQSTMERLAAIIAREQRPFFLRRYSVLPLRIDDVAREMGVHETTVYRAVQGKYLYCDRGLYPLSYFFPKEVSGGTSTARVKELIAEFCRENERISDRAIADMLQQRGITLSRRTVAKYRSQMEIHSSFHR